MSKTIDLEGVRRGKAHLKRAVELGKQRGDQPARRVPLTEIIRPATLTVEELATMTRLAAITIRRDIKSGKLKAANGGGKSAYRISQPDAEAWWRGRGGGALLDPAMMPGSEARDQARTHGIDTSGRERRLALLDAMTEGLPDARSAAGLPPLTDDDIASNYDED
jgi:excisionase family DNA binding protein